MKLELQLSCYLMTTLSWYEEKFEYNKFEGLSKPDEINNASTINNIFPFINLYW